MKKSSNSAQKIVNRQGNIKINAGGDVYNGPYQQNIVDDSSWYPIQKQETAILEKVSKFIIENIGKIGGIISGIVSLIAGGIVTFVNFIDFLSSYRSKITIPATTDKFNVGIILNGWFEQLLNWHVFLMIVGGALVIGGITILDSMQYRNQRQCPKCKKHYGLVEIGEPMEKEIKTIKGHRITQVRHYKCDKCGFEKEEKDSFIRDSNN